jgi:hypothetical protein
MDNQCKEILLFLNYKFVNSIPKAIKPLWITPMDGIQNSFKQPPSEETLNIYSNNSIQYNPDKSKVIAQCFKLQLSELKHKEVLEVFKPDNISELYKS